MAAGKCIFDLAEGLQDAGDVGLGDTDSAVRDREQHRAIRAASRPYIDTAILGRELDGVGEQVDQALLDQAPVEQQSR